ncbi:monocarboxylate transporter [Suhomyces tanzawaensis NRRL Y-17324]|uniref:Monocarboxylate transporter n=1 Tax=Suhomyces tanzawaensis NRRL Y-17324 TaxID=984487 RepID=A0A1E4SDL2_9ASCO|nr:monocarboxylate transporter [Suhomyces tanzawaensis NRRL Y-17324]ODV77482.1 monocarboxylate transporter [Suhomyces tanzawaensis NRRL Y-17324]
MSTQSSPRKSAEASYSSPGEPSRSDEQTLEPNPDTPDDSEIHLEKEVLPESDPNIDGGYAWVICFCCFLLNFSTWGMNSGFAIYFAYYLNNDTFDGATKIDYSYIGGIAFGVGLSLSPVINYIYGHLGTRWTIIIGNCAQFTGLMLASFSVKLWQLYLTQGLLQSVGLGLITVPNLTILPLYFKKRRLFASSLASAGSGVGGICFNLGMQRVVESKSVFWALRVQSIIGFGMIWIAVSLIKTPRTGSVIKYTSFDMPVFRNPGFWLLAFYVITCMFGYVIVLYTLASFTSSLGYSEYQGSISSAMVQLGSTIGRPTFGSLADRYGALTMATLAYFLCAVFCLAMWIPARNYATVIVFALVEGSMMGSIYGLISPIVAETFGISKMNVSFSMLWVLLGAAGLFSPVIGVKLTTGQGGEVDPTQYRYCSVFAGVSFFFCSLSLFLLRGYITARNLLYDNGELDAVDYTDLKVPLGMSIRSCLKNSKRKV